MHHLVHKVRRGAHLLARKRHSGTCLLESFERMTRRIMPVGCRRIRHVYPVTVSFLARIHHYVLVRRRRHIHLYCRRTCKKAVRLAQYAVEVIVQLFVDTHILKETHLPPVVHVIGIYQSRKSIGIRRIVFRYEFPGRRRNGNTGIFVRAHKTACGQCRGEQIFVYYRMYDAPAVVMPPLENKIFGIVASQFVANIPMSRPAVFIGLCNLYPVSYHFRDICRQSIFKRIIFRHFVTGQDIAQQSGRIFVSIESVNLLFPVRQVNSSFCGLERVVFHPHQVRILLRCHFTAKKRIRRRVKHPGHQPGFLHERATGGFYGRFLPARKRLPHGKPRKIFQRISAARRQKSPDCGNGVYACLAVSCIGFGKSFPHVGGIPAGYFLQIRNIVFPAFCLSIVPYELGHTAAVFGVYPRAYFFYVRVEFFLTAVDNGFSGIVLRHFISFLTII